MSNFFTIPALELRKTRYGKDAYLPSEDWSFPTEQWVPALMAIKRAKTFGEQKERASDVITTVGAHLRRLYPLGADKFVYWGYHIDARLNTRTFFDSSRLAFLSARIDGQGWAKTGYQTPDAKTPFPAYAVLDLTTYEGVTRHEVARDPAMPLTPTAKQLGHAVAVGLAHDLHNDYPGFNVLNKFANALPIPVENN